MAVLKDLIVQAMPDSPQPKPLISEHLARFAYGLRYEDIPAEVTQRAKYLVLDALGIALASTRFDFARDALAGLSMFEPGERAAFGMDRRLALREQDRNRQIEQEERNQERLDRGEMLGTVGRVSPDQGDGE